MPRPSCDQSITNLRHSGLLCADAAADGHVYARPAAVSVHDASTSTRLTCSEKSSSIYR